MSGAVGAVQGRNDAPAEPSIQRDQLFKLLSNERRRHVIQHLREREEAVTLDELATYVAAKENDTTVHEVGSLQRKHVYTALQQTHLPKMDDAGALAFDKERGVITPSETLTEFTLHLDVVSSTGVPQSALYLGLSAFSVALLVAVTAGFPLANQLPVFGCAAAVLLLFGGMAAVHRYSESDFGDADF